MQIIHLHLQYHFPACIKQVKDIYSLMHSVKVQRVGVLQL